MIRITFILLLCIAGYPILGQQLPLFTQYAEYKGLIDPSFIPYEMYAEDYKVATGLAYRDQWVQIPDRPRTAVFRYEGITDKKNGVNIIYGGYFLHDDIGIFASSEIKGRIASSITLKKTRYTKTLLTAGVNLGLGLYQVNLANAPYIEEDPELFRDNSTEVAPDAGLGISLYNTLRNADYFQIGFSMPQIINLDHIHSSDTKEFDLRRVPHYYISGSYYKMLKGHNHIEFSTWVKKVKNVPINFDAVIRYKFDSRMWVGAGFNSSVIIHTEIGVNFVVQDDNRVKAGYSFNPTFKSHGVVFGNIHEINFSYYLKR